MSAPSEKGPPPTHHRVPSSSLLRVRRFNQDPNWAETGDRYLLKLFRDYLFHQVTPEGAPWVDLAHVVQSLNKVHGSRGAGCACTG